MTIVLTTTLAILVAAPVAAQQQAPAQPAPAQQAPSPAPRDLAAGLKQAHAAIRRNLAASADKMSEVDYAFKPQGVAPEVRTYGQLIVHLINANNSACARAKGEPSKPSMDEKAAAAKAELVKALNDALTYCDGVYDAQTTASLTEMLKIQGRNNAVMEVARGVGLFSNIAHNNEHYGNLVTYMRAKGIVPPSSEGR
jgi:uncharacterized damage-inducible protein DinB